MRVDILRQLDASPNPEAILDRVNYYNRLERGSHPQPLVPISRVDRSRSRYFFDIDEYLRFFARSLRIDYVFGDVTKVPDRPSVVKSRPIEGPNANSVLFNLDKFRHFRSYHDPYGWDDKLPLAVWRGALNNPLRRALVERHGHSHFADVGHVGEVRDGLAPKPFLRPAEQLKCRYVISIEGNDVATNLKWVMASGSVCLMPRSRFETWFMEGRLEEGRHFVGLRDDFADLEEKIDMLENDPALARAIVEAANAHVAQFRDSRIERLVSILVLQKYFEATDQLPRSGLSRRLYAEAIA